jgi:SAM-dependent methyltransferase
MSVEPPVTGHCSPRAIEARGSLTWIFADGCQLPFRDKSFDVVFSNSVIEHLGDPRRHQQYAQEIARVGMRYFVQTPNRWFPVEPHLLTPFIHFLPQRWQKPMIEKFTIWEWIARPRPDQRAFYLAHYLRDIQLLDGRAMRRLFPDARLIRERFLGLTKSLIAIR